MRRLASILILILAAVSAEADIQSTVLVRPECEIAGASIRISDISAVRSSNEETASTIRSAEIGPSPSPGRSRTIRRDDIIIAMRRAGIDDRSVNLLCPERISIARSAIKVTGQSIFEAAESYARTANTWIGIIEIEPVRLPSDVDAPTGKLELSVKPGLRSIRRGQNSVNVQILIDGQSYRTVTATLMIKELAPVLVATQAISKSTPITMANAAIRQRDITTMSDDAMVNQFTPGVVASIPIGEDTVIRKSWLTQPSVVHTGDEVLVTVESGAVRIADKGVAVQDGSIGQIVKIRLETSDREVRAAVTGPGAAKISIPGGDSR
jgi:flagella basal body P-ring formation protein FlgA